MEFVTRPPREQAAIDSAPFDRWLSPEGDERSQFFRDGRNFRVRFLDLADFAIDFDRKIVTGIPVPGLPDDSLTHLYRNQIVPLIMGYDGDLVLHASAVRISGEAIAFVGNSRRGKSTLAAAFARAGHPFLTDDGLILAKEEKQYLVLPREPDLRLCPDSASELFGRASDPETSSDDWKSRIPASAAIPHSNQPTPLGALFFLANPQGRDEPSIESLARPAAIAQLLQHCFILDSEDGERLKRLFDRLIDLSATVDCFLLDYPRDFSRLPLVLDFLIDRVERVQS